MLHFDLEKLAEKIKPGTRTQQICSYPPYAVSTPNDSRLLSTFHPAHRYRVSLARRKGAGINNFGGIFLDLLSRSRERGTRKGHEARPGRLKDTEWGNQFHERVDATGFGGTIDGES